MRKSLKSIESIVWDFDGVHYRYDHDTMNIYELCDQTAAEVALGILPGLSYEDALELSRRSYAEHGDCVGSYVEWAKAEGHDSVRARYEIFRGYHASLFNKLVMNHGEIFRANADTIAAFRAAPQIKHALATHSCADTLGRPMLTQLGLIGFFQPNAIHGLDHVNFSTKSTSTALVELALKSLKTPAHKAAFVEDTIPNLERAKDIDSRLTTIFVHHGKPLAKLPSCVDLQTENPASLMRLLAR